MATVTTSIVVEFKKEGSSVLTAEIDSRPTGFNNGRTSFSPGDSAVFLLFKTDDVTVDSLISSYGVVEAVTPIPPATDLYEVEEWLTFADTDTASLSKPYTIGLTYEWYGTNLGTLTPDGTSIRAATKGVGVAKVKYRSRFTAHSIASPLTMNGKSDFQILVFVAGHTDA